jgi:serine/threonine protein kinase
MSEHVVTRWYRAPELLLSCAEYTSSIDVWSVGCIFAELLGRKPVFPGKDYVHQLNLITKVIGSPSEEDLMFIRSEKARRYIRSLPKHEHVGFRKLYPQANEQALDLIGQMLVFDPNRRITVEQALEHPYLASLHDVNDEPSCERQFDFDFEAEALSEKIIADIIYDDMLTFHADLREEPA